MTPPSNHRSPRRAADGRWWCVPRSRWRIANPYTLPIRVDSYIDKNNDPCIILPRSCSSNADYWKDGGATNGEPVWSKNHRKRRTQWRWGWELTAYRTLEWRQCSCRDVCAVAREKNAPRTVRIVRSPK